MNIINLDKSSLGLESEEEKFVEFAQTNNCLQRTLWRMADFLVKRNGHMPYLFFSNANVDAAVVNELLNHPNLLDSVFEWVENNNKDEAPKLVEAKKVFEAIQKPQPASSTLYRGFSVTSGQQTHGLDRQAYEEMEVGEKFEDTPTRAVSFSSHEEVAQAYGNIIVTVAHKQEAERMFHITPEVMVAMCMNQEGEADVNKALQDIGGKLFTYAESIFLPDDKPLEFTLFKK